MIKFIFTLFFFVPVYIFQFINAEQLTNKKYEIKKELFVKNHNDLNSEINLLVNEIFSLITKDNNKAFNKANFALQKLKKSDPNFEFVGLYYQIYNLLGLLYRNKEDFKNSESFFSKSLELINKKFGNKNDYFVYTQIELADVLLKQGLFKKAQKINDEATNNIKELYGNKSLYLIKNINHSGKIDLEFGKFQKAKEKFLNALNIIKENTKDKNKDISSNSGLIRYSSYDYLLTLSNLGFVNNILGDHIESEKFYIKAIEVFKSYKVRNSDNDLYSTYPHLLNSIYLDIYAKLLNNLGSLYIDLRKLNKAESFLLDALKINQKSNSEKEIATNLLNLGTIYKDQGLIEKAEENLLKSLEIHERVYGKENINLTSILTQLSNLYSFNLEYDKSKPLLLRTLEIQKNFLPLEHPRISTTLNNLAVIYQKENSFKSAEKIYIERLKIDKKNYGNLHPNLAMMKYNLGKNYFKQGVYSKAEYYLRESLKDFEEIFGNQNRELQNSIEDLAILYYIKKDFKKANYFYKKGSINAYKYIFDEVPYLIEEERLLGSAFGRGTFIFQFALENPLMAENALFMRLNRYGVLDEIERYQFELMRSTKGEFKILRNKRKNIIKKLSNLNLNKKEKISLIKQKQQLEKTINNAIPLSKYKHVEVNDVAKSLKQDEILIEFTRYYPYRIFDESLDLENPKYLALTLNANSEVKVFDLGNAIKLEDKIFEAYWSIRDIKRDISEIEYYLDQVSELVFQKDLKDYINKYKTIYISPDFALQKIPINLLRDPVTKKYLSTNKDFIVVASGKDLIRKKYNKSPTQNSVIVANPNYDNLDKKIIKENSSFGINKNNLRSKELLSSRWLSRKGFKEEGETIQNLLNGNLISGNNATVQNVLKIKSPKILHIVTHGFYFSPSKENKNALTRTGIVMAGANDKNILEDGYLTALEIGGMDLSGTELVTISSCDSGEGDLRPYESLNGIGRSLLNAGAKSTLLSLWKVDDEATTAFMIDFYKNLKNGMYKNEALTRTQKKFRDGLIKSEFGNDWTNIFYWGAFQISGDMKPIKF